MPTKTTTAKKVTPRRKASAAVVRTADPINRPYREPDSLADILGESWVESAPGIYYRVPAQF